MNVNVSRQGLRRLTLLNPSTAFHDSLSPISSLNKFPRVLLDQTRRDTNKHFRRKLEKENDIKRFGKLGVSRTHAHNIPDLVDCEYVGLSDLGEGIKDAIRRHSDAPSLLLPFLEQASERLKKGADLIEINELIAIVSEMVVSTRFYDLKLMNKVKNEVLYDMHRVQAPELAALFNSFALINIVSPKLVNNGLCRLKQLLLVEPAENNSVNIALVIRSLRKIPSELISQNFSDISFLLKEITHAGCSLTFPEQVALAKDVFLINQRLRAGQKLDLCGLTQSIASTSSVTDLESAADALFLFASRGETNPEFLTRLDNFVKTHANEILSMCQDTEPVNIERRNRAVNIAAEIFVACTELNLPASDIYRNSFTEVSVKGLNCRHLVKLSRVLPNDPWIANEIDRKINSFSQKQRESLRK